jgi:hypothetical protein
MSMVRFWSRVDHFFKWAEHGYFAFQILVSLGVGKLVGAILRIHTQIPEAYITPIWWLSAAAAMGALIGVTRLTRSRKPPVIQATTVTETGGVNLEMIEKMRREFQGPLIQECEKSIGESAEKIKPDSERVKFLLRNLATVIVVAFFETTWQIIFGSQIRALERLNRGMAKIDDLFPYYNENLEKRPQYPFESWFGYLKNQLLIRQDGYNVNITVRGKEFLKFLVQSGRTANDKQL